MVHITVNEEWVDVNGLRIHCLQAGESGSPVILLHGGGTDSAALSWKEAIPALAVSHRVYAPDWPGFGDSDKPDMAYSMDTFIDCLGGLMDALGLARASLVGISLGGGVALGFTLRSPDRVDRLVLLDSYGLQAKPPFPLISYLFVRMPFINELTWALMASSRGMVRQTLRQMFHDPSRVSEEMVDEVYRLVRQPGAGRAWRSLQRNEVTPRGLRTLYLDRLGEISVPTLILHGAQDTLVPVACAKEAHARIKGSEFHLVEGCGHWLPREKPEEFNRLVTEFLSVS
jgi:pimeloyl-ACP methyl ester carboxylesterase